MRQEAREIAQDLLRRLKAGEIETIDIEQIREAIREKYPPSRSIGYSTDRFEEQVTREVVNLV